MHHPCSKGIQNMCINILHGHFLDRWKKWKNTKESFQLVSSLSCNIHTVISCHSSYSTNQWKLFQRKNC